MSKKTIRQLPLHFMLLPGLLLVLIYSYVPFFGLSLAFVKFLPGRPFTENPWVGFEHFRYVWEMPNSLRVLGNTFYIAFFKIVVGQIVPIIVALLLNELRKNWLKRGVQTLIYLPHFLSWIILGGILIDILSPSQGIVNQLLGMLGIKPIYFLGDNNWFPFTIIVTDVWKEFGFNTVVYLAALTSINPALYEAALIDGANRWKQTLHITLPGMLPIIVLLATLSLGNVLNAGFDQIFNLYSPSVYQTGDIIDTLVYRTGLEQAQYSVATAIGLFKSVVSFFMVSLSYFLAYRLANYRIF
ncbi:ABC transporter permease [Paenibacillus sacheonensis]|uniref:ABC transporter permease subunit n=1 Tax=Paenibacillus sacheonensis TaxID=742054 RepID=A0A7X5C469_9BACL|nr:ABC transporter permease subunit [Paenibacillus sacheonensis]MBM7569195.1 putative aldouronate transport system permease protein [Paenibacillus sacheonensis]NBC73020.1 ABC transporter permease subunit [Paenibacillus sacheonensis]